MALLISEQRFNDAWDRLLLELQTNGKRVVPRGFGTKELENVTLEVHSPLYNVLVNTARDANYRFMVAEWLWIYFGHNDLASILQYNQNLARTSDDQQTLQGAYGPHIAYAWHLVKQNLQNDRESRQAVIPIWGMRTNRGSKDVPCTISLQFMIRNQRLNMTANMRSSDIWLGLVYDFYVFTQLQNLMSHELDVGVGTATLNLGSSHLYDVNFKMAEEASKRWKSYTVKSPKIWSDIPKELDKAFTERTIQQVSVGGETIWDYYPKILTAPTKNHALGLMKELEKVSDENV